MIPFTKIEFNIPNILSGLRFLLTPPLLVLLATVCHEYSFDEITVHGLLVIALFFLIILSDIVDGIAARKLKIESETGKQFDILADFFYRFSLLIYFCIEGKIHYVFLIIFFLIFLLFISGFTPFRIFKSNKILYYSGRSVPVAVTILIGTLLFEKVFFTVKIFYIINTSLKHLVYLISFIVLITKLVVYNDKSWKITGN